MRARKKPVEITFEIFDPAGGNWPVGCMPLTDLGLDRGPCKECGNPLSPEWHGWVETREGGHIACPFDRIITGVEGERYPCKPAIFDKTYEVIAK